MPIDKPDSGTIITKASIENMHEQVRSVINAVPSVNLGRGTFNIEQLPSLIARSNDTSAFHMRGIVNVTQPCDVKSLADQTVTTFSDTAPNTWDELQTSSGSNPYFVDELELNDGWFLKEDDVVFAFLCCRIRKTTQTTDGHQMWLGLNKTIRSGWLPALGDETPVLDAVDVGCVRLEDSSGNYGRDLEETITIASAFNGTTFGYSGDWTLAKIRVHGVMIQAEGAAFSGEVFEVTNGTIGAFVLRTSGIQT